MSYHQTEPLSAPSVLEPLRNQESEAIVKTSSPADQPCSVPDQRILQLCREVDSLNEDQLQKLTRSNTRKNHGGRKSRFRSQIERVCRRIDNLAADAKLQPRYSLNALPVVEPANASEIVAAPTKEGQVKTDEPDGEPVRRIQRRDTGFNSLFSVQDDLEEKSRSMIELPIALDDAFDIEPATDHFLGEETGIASVKSCRSVRISASVTILDYANERDKAEPLSVSTQKRFEHPTRSGKDLQLRRCLSQDTLFPRAKISLEAKKTDEDNQKVEGTEKREGRGRTGVPIEKQSRRRGQMSQSLPPRMGRARQVSATSIDYVSPTAGGAYGPRSPTS